MKTKLYKNPDKRLVVAQVLDYGASLWSVFKDPSQFVDALEEAASEEFGTSLELKVKEFYDLEDDDWPTLIETIKENIHDGKLRFVVLMDKLHSQLKDLILFINKNSQFDVFAVEIEYYKHEDTEIMIPKLFGEEAKTPSPGTRGNGRSRNSWKRQAKKSEITRPFPPLRNYWNFPNKKRQEVLGNRRGIRFIHIQIRASEI